MTSKHKEISRREFLTMSTQNAAGIFATTALISCTTPQELPTDKDPIIDDNENRQMVTCYEIDPTWPQKPDEFTWGAVPGVAVDMHDRVWIITRSLPAVQVYDADGKFLMAWGKKRVEADTSNLPANKPVDISFDIPNPVTHYLEIDNEGNVWFTDCNRHVVYKCAPDGKLLLTIGTLNESGDDETHFNKPTDMAVTNNGVFVADGYGNNRIVHFDSKGRFIKAWGRKGTSPGEFNTPHAIAIDSKGHIYVADRGNARVQVFDQSSKFLDEWRNILVPWGLWISGGDDIWICGSSPMSTNVAETGIPPKDQLVMRFNPQGKLLQLWTMPKGIDGQEKPGELNWVHGIALDSKGNIYLGDIIGKRVQKFVRQ